MGHFGSSWGTPRDPPYFRKIRASQAIGKMLPRKYIWAQKLIWEPIAQNGFSQGGLGGSWPTTQRDQPEEPILSIWAPRVIFEPKQISGVAFCQWFFGARIFLKSGDHWECLTQVSFFSLLFCQRKAKQPSANARSKFSLFPSAAPT